MCDDDVDDVIAKENMLCDVLRRKDEEEDDEDDNANGDSSSAASTPPAVDVVALLERRIMNMERNAVASSNVMIYYVASTV